MPAEEPSVIQHKQFNFSATFDFDQYHELGVQEEE